MNDAPLQFQLLDGFTDARVNECIWNDLVEDGPSDVIFLTYQYQKTWWEAFGRGQLLLVVAFMDSQPLAIAPLFADGSMIFFVGSGGSDYLDFIGQTAAPGVLQGMLDLAREQVGGFLGFRFYHIPDSSQTHGLLGTIADDALDLFQEETWSCPLMDLKSFPEQALEATRKKSLLRHHTWFEKRSGIEVQHLRHATQILPYLDDFFDQHIKRWAVTDYPSLFHEPKQRAFYRALIESLSGSEWVCFTRIGWQGQAIAFHFGFNYHRNFLWYKPSFEISLSKHGPGEVLLRQLIIHALKEEAHTFDFGMGDEAFKQRFATNTPSVKNIGLYPGKLSDVK